MIVEAAGRVGGVAVLAAVVERLGVLGDSPAELVDQVSLLEDLKRAAEAEQLRLTARFTAARADKWRAAGVKPADAKRSAAGELALARRESQDTARKRAAVADVLIADMPLVVGALQSGVIGEWHATTIARQTVLLTPDQRRVVDEEIAPKLRSSSVKQLKRLAKRIAQRLAPDAEATLTLAAEAERCVTIRNNDDGTVYLTGRLPMVSGVAAYASLHHAAASAKAAGDERGRGQLMGDVFVHRIGQPQVAVALEQGLDVDLARNAHGDHSTSIARTADAEGFGVAGSAPETAVRANVDANSENATPTLGDNAGPDAGSSAAPSTRPAIIVAPATSALLPAGCSVEIQLVMTAQTLFGDNDDPMVLPRVRVDFRTDRAAHACRESRRAGVDPTVVHRPTHRPTSRHRQHQTGIS